MTLWGCSSFLGFSGVCSGAGMVLVCGTLAEHVLVVSGFC